MYLGVNESGKHFVAHYGREWQNCSGIDRACVVLSLCATQRHKCLPLSCTPEYGTCDVENLLALSFIFFHLPRILLPKNKYFVSYEQTPAFLFCIVFIGLRFWTVLAGEPHAMVTFISNQPTTVKTRIIAPCAMQSEISPSGKLAKNTENLSPETDKKEKKILTLQGEATPKS